MPARLEVESSGAMDAALDRLVREDALGQLLDRSGRMAALATENEDIKLDWADQAAWILDHPQAIDEVETLASGIRSRFEHVIWSGMGGSVQAVHALKGLGLLAPGGLSVHPLDSTDPAALNRLLRGIGGEHDLGGALQRTLMVGVSMGMTSEEPITHLKWFEELLRAHAIERPAEHLLVMTLPGSFLDRFAEERGVRRESIQLDGQSHTPGRMSAPSTRVFLLPAALGLAGGVRDVLERCQAEFQLRQGMTAGERAALITADPFARLAVWLSANITDGRDMVVLDLPDRWAPFAPWVEQVVEESLGKEGRGLLVFHGQDLSSTSRWPDRFGVLRIDDGSGADVPNRPLAKLHLETEAGNVSRLAVCARFFSGWNVAVALVGYLQGITFAGQPAVEGYKKYARQLRDKPGELPYPTDRMSSTGTGRLKLFSGAAPAADLDSGRSDAATVLAAVIQSLETEGRLDYFDLTVNGEPAGPLWETAKDAGMRFGNAVLNRPAKVRSGPRDYHSTEQSETAGPPGLLSLRVLIREQEPVVAGDYDGRFLHAQALGTLFAMRDAGRPVLLAMVRREDGGEAVAELLEDATARLGAASTALG
jgi:glucose-6-phosphate isomerase